MVTNNDSERTGVQVFTKTDPRSGRETKFELDWSATKHVPVWVAAKILGIAEGSVRALVKKDPPKIKEVPKVYWPNGKCQMVFLDSVLAYEDTRGPSRFRPE